MKRQKSRFIPGWAAALALIPARTSASPASIAIFGIFAVVSATTLSAQPAKPEWKLKQEERKKKAQAKEEEDTKKREERKQEWKEKKQKLDQKWEAQQQENAKSRVTDKGAEVQQMRQRDQAAAEARAKRNEEWVERNIKGSDMRKVYEQHNKGQPSYTKESGGDIIWNYKSQLSDAIWSECEDYTFNSSGKLKDQKKYRCE